MSRTRWHPAYIGIGSNLDGPEEQIENALAALGRLPESVLVLASPRYLSQPVGPEDQPDFINAVAALLTRMAPLDLLHELQRIERDQGRDRTGRRWGPRTVDLDLLSYAGIQCDTTELVLPHPRIAERNFVLFPWRDIAPHYAVPGLAAVAELADRVAPDQPGIRRLS